VSFAMKGMMGMVLDRRSMHWRYDLHQGIVDICRVLNPALVITDATRALVTRGPGGPGRVETPDAIVAGTKMTTVDAYTLTLAKWYNKGFTWNEVPHLKLAHEQGFGEVDPSKMNVKRITL
jgi:uncharacterized protein (DUF362 family)